MLYMSSPVFIFDVILEIHFLLISIQFSDIVYPSCVCYTTENNPGILKNCAHNWKVLVNSWTQWLKCQNSNEKSILKYFIL